jgi:hypothetical protein
MDGVGSQWVVWGCYGSWKTGWAGGLSISRIDIGGFDEDLRFAFLI